MSDLSILGLDIASQAGWGYGSPGTVPRLGTVRWAPPGSPTAKVAAGMIRWVLDFTRVNRVDAVFFEAPFDPRIMGKKTNFNTTRMLVGLPFLLEGVLELKEIELVREVTVADVRKHFLGVNPRGDEGKARVQQRCRELGWAFDSADAADAGAVWSFACAIVAPKSSIATAPLFQAKGRAHRDLVEKTWPNFSEFAEIEDIPE